MYCFIRDPTSKASNLYKDQQRGNDAYNSNLSTKITRPVRYSGGEIKFKLLTPAAKKVYRTCTPKRLRARMSSKLSYLIKQSTENILDQDRRRIKLIKLLQCEMGTHSQYLLKDILQVYVPLPFIFYPFLSMDFCLLLLLLKCTVCNFQRH